MADVSKALRMRKRLTSLGFCLGTLCASPAWAENAADLFDEGIKAFEEKQLGKAIDLLAKANALKPHPDVQYNLAYICAESGRHREALKWYEAYLNQPVPPADRLAVEASITSLKSRLNLAMETKRDPEDKGSSEPSGPAPSEARPPTQAQDKGDKKAPEASGAAMARNVEPQVPIPNVTRPARPSGTSVAYNVALDEPIPAGLRAAVLARILMATPTLKHRQKPKVLVVFAEARRRDQEDLIRALRVAEVEVKAVSNQDLASEIADASAVYLGPGGGSVKELTQKHSVLTVTGVPDLVEAGEASLGIGVEANKPLILLNLKQLRREKHKMPPQIEQVARKY